MKKEDMPDFEENRKDDFEEHFSETEIWDMNEPETGQDEDEDDLDEFDEKEGLSFTTILLAAGVIIPLILVGCIVFLILKGGKEDDLALTETTQAIVSEEQTVSETMGTKAEITTEEMQTESAAEEETESIPQTEIQNENGNVEAEESVSEPVESVPDTELPKVQEPVSVQGEMEFAECNDTITAKDVTNLRSAPSTLDEGNIVSQLSNGETLLRTGINETTGWSRLDYGGQTVYAVNNYLTTDLNYKPPVVSGNPNRVATKDGRIIIFTDHNDYITPKEYVNLRTEPSTSEGDSTVKTQANNGEILHRTGYSADSGWSRIEYNGEILYVVSSMVSVTENAAN